LFIEFSQTGSGKTAAAVLAFAADLRVSGLGPLALSIVEDAFFLLSDFSLPHDFGVKSLETGFGESIVGEELLDLDANEAIEVLAVLVLELVD